MEDGLRRPAVVGWMPSQIQVLILVVMEDGLRLWLKENNKI